MLIHTPKNLAQFYRDERKRQGLSQTAVAQEISLRQDTVSKFELKPENVRMDTLFRLLSALDLELHLIPKNRHLNDLKNSGWTEKW